VDVFSSHHHEVARQHSQINYDTMYWRRFFDSLKFIYQIERELYESEIVTSQYENQQDLMKSMIKQID